MLQPVGDDFRDEAIVAGRFFDAVEVDRPLFREDFVTAGGLGVGDCALGTP